MTPHTKNIFITSVVVIAVLVGGGYFLSQYLNSSSSGTPSVEPTAPLYVPVSTPSADGKGAILETKLGTSVSGAGFTVTALEVLEESRCPVNAVCIQAGTVRVRVKIATNFGEEEKTLTLGTPVTVSAGVVELFDVRPEPRAGVSIAPADYRFTFRVTTGSVLGDVKG